MIVMMMMMMIMTMMMMMINDHDDDHDVDDDLPGYQHLHESAWIGRLNISHSPHPGLSHCLPLLLLPPGQII